MATVPLPESLPGNSHNKKPTTSDLEVDRPKIEKVVQGKVTTHKKSVFKKIGESFTGDDAQTVGQYLVLEVLVPALKAMLSDATTEGVNRLLFGGQRPGAARRSSFGGYSQPHTNYANISTGRAELSRRARATHDFREISFESRTEALMALDVITDFADKYDAATVSDLYDAVGITSDYTDKKYGWTRSDLKDARVVRYRNGYLLEMPDPAPLR